MIGPLGAAMMCFLLAIDCKKHIIAVTPIFLPCITSFTSSRSGTYLWFDVMLSKCMEVSFLVIFMFCFFFHCILGVGRVLPRYFALFRVPKSPTLAGWPVSLFLA